MRIDRGSKEYIRVFWSKTREGWVKVATRNYLEEEFEPASSVLDGDVFLVVTRPEGAPRNGLYKFDPLTFTYEGPIFEPDAHDLSFIKNATWSDDLVYAAWWEDELERHWFDETMEAKGRKLSDHYEGKANWSLLETDRNEDVWLVYRSSDEYAGGYEIWLTDQTKIVRLTSSRRVWGRTRFGPHPGSTTRRLTARLCWDISRRRGAWTPKRP